MLTLPEYLSPDSVELIVPKQPISSNGYLNGLQSRNVKSLSSLHIKAGLKLIFTDHPIDLIQRVECISHKSLSIGGYALAYQWYRDETISGHLPFAISPTHRLWDICNYRIKLQNYTNALSYKVQAFEPPLSKHNKIATWSIVIVVANSGISI
jgi:hypothetical protein